MKDPVIIPLIEVAKGVLGFMTTKKEQDEATKRTKLEAKRDILVADKEAETKKVESQNQTIRKAVDEVGNTAQTAVKSNTEIAKEGMAISNRVAEKTLEQKQEIVIGLKETQKALLSDRDKERESHKNLVDTFHEKEERQHSQMEKQNQTIVNYQEILGRMTKLLVAEKVKHQYMENLLHFVSPLVALKEEISQTKQKIKTIEKRISPEQYLIDEITRDMMITNAFLEDLDKKFDEKVHLIRYLKDDDLNEQYEKEKKQLEYILKEIEQKELEVLNKELAKINKEELILKDLMELEELKYTLDVLEGKEMTSLFSGLSHQFSQMNGSKTEDAFIEASIEESPNNKNLIEE
jgi:hypothetical protein